MIQQRQCLPIRGLTPTPWLIMTIPIVQMRKLTPEKRQGSAPLSLEAEEPGLKFQIDFKVPIKGLGCFLVYPETNDQSKEQKFPWPLYNTFTDISPGLSSGPRRRQPSALRLFNRQEE